MTAATFSDGEGNGSPFPTATPETNFATLTWPTCVLFPGRTQISRFRLQRECREHDKNDFLVKATYHYLAPLSTVNVSGFYKLCGAKQQQGFLVVDLGKPSLTSFLLHPNF